MLDTRNHCLTKENVEITITDADYNLLQIFVTHPNQILSRDKLMNLLKGFCDYRYNRCIDVRVRRLRKKIESNSSTPHYIRTVRNKGYLFTPQGKRT